MTNRNREHPLQKHHLESPLHFSMHHQNCSEFNLNAKQQGGQGIYVCHLQYVCLSNCQPRAVWAEAHLLAPRTILFALTGCLIH